MNNDKPKDDDWAMSNPNIQIDKELSEEEVTPQVNQPSDADWTMTTPNVNLAQQILPSDDYGQTAPNVNVPQEDWTINVPPPQAQTTPPTDDWSMTTPNVNLSADTDKTTPNFNIPAEVLGEPPEKSAPTDNFDLSMPYIPESRENKREGGWQMPQPVFRISTGKEVVHDATQPEISAPIADFSDQSAPYFDGSETINQPAPQAEVAAPSVAPVKKKRSKIPLVLGGLFTFFFLTAAGLAAVYFVFLRGGSELAKSSNTPIATPNTSESANSNTTSANTVPTNTNAKTESSLPKEIDFKGKMMLVSAGSFTMGSDAGETISKPAHKVDLPAFYIDRTEVTNAQYKEFCDATGRSVPTPQYWNKDYFTARPNAPVVGISFEDAKAFADWAGKRLPTEAEWEKAASWDEIKQTKNEFPWGNAFSNANAAFGIAELADVGKYPAGASPFGAMDMSGNAAEWVDAFFKAFPNNPANDENFGEKNRVVRGGFFNSDNVNKLKTTKRFYVPPDFLPSGEMASYIGFRCAISADDSRLKDSLSK